MPNQFVRGIVYTREYNSSRVVGHVALETVRAERTYARATGANFWCSLVDSGTITVPDTIPDRW